MKQKETIFDETFDAPVLIRRRALMPLPLKIYVWAFMVIGILGATFFTIGVFAEDAHGNDAFFNNNRFFVVAVILVFFLITLLNLLLWLEAKWAIRINQAFAIIWIGKAFHTFITSGLNRFDLVIAGVIFLPFWIILISIQKRWEQHAVTGKQAKALS